MNDIELNSVLDFNSKYSALMVRNAYKRYSPTNVVLNGLNMNVPSGCIYGLLGPSGCGKTTLLNAIVGNSKLDSGTISWKIKKLNELGYMPQTLSLHTQMTVMENITFYGYLYSITPDDLKNRINNLVAFLELPDKHCCIAELSEGQKRRVSLIISLIHEPEVLILDEPTVGMDLIISGRIWKRLLQMTSRGVTIIITTHYIQEAQQAHKIGLMRAGVLLAEESPQELMEKHACEDLESVFLLLSQQQSASCTETQNYPVQESTSQPFKDDFDRMFSKKKIRGIVYKDIKLLKRGYTFLISALFMSTAVIITFNFVIGKPPKNLNIGVINDESSLAKCNLKDLDACFFNENSSLLFSCALTDFLRNETYKITEYHDETIAINDFKKNKIYAILHFQKNYTKALGRRFIKFSENLDSTVVSQSLLDFWVDRTNKYMQIFITLDVAMAMLTFIKRILLNCNLNPRIVLPPIHMEKPIFGSMDDNFTSYTLVPFLFLNAFTWPMISIAVFFLSEKCSGVMDRVLKTGASILDMMFSFFLIQIILQFFSTLITIIVIFGICDNSMYGNMFLFSTLLMLISISGMVFGLLIGLIHSDARGLGVTLGCLNSGMMFFAGIVRPLEEQHIILKIIGTILPITWSIKGLQAIRFKNKHIFDSPVLEAFSMLIVLTVALALIIFYLIRQKKTGCIQCLATTDDQPVTFSLL